MKSLEFAVSLLGTDPFRSIGNKWLRLLSLNAAVTPSPELDAERSDTFLLIQLSAAIVAMFVNLVPLFRTLFVII